MAYKNNFLTGITELLVLTILNEKGVSYVYEITKYIAVHSRNSLSLSLNTVYTVMYKLENDQMISEYTTLVGKKRTRIYYHIETAGKERLYELTQNYNQITKGVDYVLTSFTKKDTNDE